MKNPKELADVRDMILSLSRKFRGDLKKRLAKSGTGITPLAYNLLCLLENRTLTLREIAREMEINPPTLVAAADILEKKNLLTRTMDKSDRRRTPLQITKAGALLLKKIPKVSRADLLATGFEKLNKNQRVELKRLLSKLLS